MYSKTYMQHFAKPQNIGKIENPTCFAEVENKEGGCFDKATLYVNIDDKRIIEAKFQARACSGTIMAFSLLTSKIIDKELAEVKLISFEELNEDVGGIPEKKAHSLRLAIEAKDIILSKLGE